MAIPVMEFQVRGHTIVVIQSYLKIDVIKKCEKIVLLDWYSSTEKTIEKDSDDFWHRKLTLKVKF